MSKLKGQLVVEGVVSDLLVANLSNLFLSSLISLCIGENAETSFLFDDADVLLASKWTRRSSSTFWPSRSNILRVGFSAPLVRSLSCDLLVANLSNLFLSSLISLCIGENAETSFLFDDADVLLASKWTRRSSSTFWPSRSNILRVGFSAPLVRSLSCDPCGAADLSGRADTVPLLGLDSPALVFIFLLFGMAEWVDSTRDWGTSWEFVQCPKATLPCMVVLAACCSARRSSTAVSPSSLLGLAGRVACQVVAWLCQSLGSWILQLLRAMLGGCSFEPLLPQLASLLSSSQASRGSTSLRLVEMFSC